MKLRAMFVGMFLLLIMAGGRVWAEESYSYSVTPYAGYHWYNDERDFKDRPEFGLKIEKFLTHNWSVEAGLGYERGIEKSTNNRKNIITHNLNGLYNFKVTDRYWPYITGGVGGDTINGDTLLGPNLGVGIRFLVSKEMALRAEVRDVFLFKGRNDVIALVGISYLFGKSAEHSAPIKEEVALVKKTEAVVKPAPIVVDGDNDGDGIVDSADKCRLTPKGTAVDKNGCPLDADKDNVTDALDKCPGTLAGVSVDEAGCPVDADKDKVADYLDKCLGTSAGVTVDKNGCPIPLDADKDNVTDALDKCPRTLAGVAVDEAGCPVDADKDKVADYLDKCLGTSAGVTVDKNGCPIPLDADKDNVTDALDKCPGTLAGVAVDEAGCPVDADKDKVADYLDKCLSTPSGAKVDSNGCVVSVTLNVTFDSGKAVVKAEHDAEITKLANFLKENPDLKVEIQGHTDNVGNANTNKKLSEDRAMAIKQRLVTQNGIASDRVTSVGYGQEKPIASNDTAEGKLANRRVEAVILK